MESHLRAFNRVKHIHICDFQRYGVRVEELDEGGQKVQASCYNMNKYWGCEYNVITIFNTAILCI